jgi:Spy/CpxP family protein refolding chaperone
LLVFVGAVARAEDPHEHGGSSEWKARWAEHMGLSEEEAGKLEAGHKEARKAMKPLHRELRDAMTKLRDQVEDEAGDDALKATLERVEKARRALAAEHDRAKAKLAELLPPAKRAKLILSRMGRRHGIAMMPHGMRGGFAGHEPQMPRRGPGMQPKRRHIEREYKIKDSLNEDEEDEDEEPADEE